MSPKHARNVALVLSTTTGLASPQFHAKVDDRFETTRPDLGALPTESLWQAKCGFTSTPKTKAARPAKAGVARPVQPTQDMNVPESPETEQEPVEQESQDSEGAEEVPYTTRHGRKVYKRGLCPRIVAYEAVLEEFPTLEEHPLLSMAASADPDTIHYHQAMREDDAAEFHKAVAKEMLSHLKNGNFVLVKKSTVPEGAQTLPAAWAMKRKRRIDAREVCKHKARLNIDGSNKIKGLSYWDAYSPVVSWPSIRVVLTIALMLGWPTTQIDFVLAHTQAKAETDNLCMEIPRGFHLKGFNMKDYVFHVKKNLYGQRQSGRVWNTHLVKKLKDIGFKQSAWDECIFHRGNCIYVLYTDDSMLTAPTQQEIDKVAQDMKDAGSDITMEGDVGDFLGMKIEHLKDGKIKSSQPHLINSILQDLRLQGEEVTIKETPGAPSKTRTGHAESPDFDNHFHCHSVIGKLNYLEKCSRPDISCAVHKCAQYSTSPKKEHGEAVKWLGHYLAGTRDQGIICTPTSESVECFVDADFCGEWTPNKSDNPATAKSRTGYIICKCAGCPLVWASKKQSLIVLSTTEAKYLALSDALREVTPLLGVIREMREHGFDTATAPAKVHCKTGEDNSGALELSNVHKTHPRTKHINVRVHHFRSHIGKDTTVHPIPTKEQQADILTEIVDVATLKHLHPRVQGF